MPHPKNGPRFLAAILFIWGMCVMLVLPMGPYGEKVPGNLGDTRLNNYFLEHGYLWISGQVDSYRDASFFYPDPGVMTYSDTHFGTLPFYALFRAAGMTREGAYQWWLIAIFVLNFWTCYWALKKIGASSAGAGIGAFVFTFSLPVASQIVHSQLLPRFLVPIVFYSVWRWVRKRESKSAALFSAALVWQLYCGIYIGMFTLMAAVVFLVVTKTGDIKKSPKDELPKTKPLFSFGFLIIAAAAVFPLVFFYVSSPAGVEGVSREGIMYYMPRLFSYVLPADGSLLWRFLEPVGKYLITTGEQQLFPGALPLCAFVVVAISAIPGLFKYHEEKFKFTFSIVITGAVLILFTLTIAGWSPYLIIGGLPGFSGIRAVSRLILVLLFPFAAASAFAFDHVEEKVSRLCSSPRTVALKILAVVLMAAAFAADQFIPPAHITSYSKTISRARVNNIVESIPPIEEVKSFYYAALDSPDSLIASNIDAMLASQETGLPTVNGYSGRFPVDYFFYDEKDYRDALKHWMLAQDMKREDKSCEANPFDGLVIIEKREKKDLQDHPHEL